MTSEGAEWLQRLTREMGRRLAESGSGGVPAQDLALLALLQARRFPQGEAASVEAAAAAIPGQDGTISRQSARKPTDETEQVETVSKGEEGLRQALEQFSELLLSERLVMTGDVTAGFQGATVSQKPNLESVFGRARVNFVLRALPSQKDSWEEGVFFVQTLAAGGAADASAVGGPASFSAFDDVATDRSQFNESARGNLVLSKAYYEQGFRLGRDRVVARTGILDISDYLDTNEFANNEARQFLNGAFVNGAGFKSGIGAPGLVAEYQRPLDREWLQGMVFRVGSAFSRTDRAFTSPLWTGELELQTRWKGYSGHWRAGGTWGNVAGAGAIRGGHLSLDQ